MSRVGLLCNCTTDQNPREQLSTSLVNRAVMMDELLARDGIRLFLYSPRDVDGSPEVPGYRVDRHDFVPERRPIPAVNANWTYGTRRLIDKGMGYKRFKRWTRENQVGIFVPYEFSELVSNKQKAHEVVREYEEGLHPYTEDFSGSRSQLQRFIELSNLTFVKPRAGNRGNRIFVLRPLGEGVSVKYYEDGDQRVFPSLTLEAALGVIDIAASESRYVVQEGIESVRYGGAVFDVRVVMVNDGRCWHSIFESRLAPEGSDLSNVFQGGSIKVTEELLTQLWGEEEAQALRERVRAASHGVAEHLEARYPAQLMELGFDFVIDDERGIHLVEVNAKPGVAGFGSEQRVFDWKPEERHYYDRWLRPHVEHLAAFFRAKIEQTGAPT